jgi:hypothetical protein
MTFAGFFYSFFLTFADNMGLWEVKTTLCKKPENTGNCCFYIVLVDTYHANIPFCQKQP